MPSRAGISRKTFLPLLSTIVLFLSVITGVYLTQQQQELRSKAATDPLLSWDVESGELRGMYCSGNCPEAVSSASHPVRSGSHSMRSFLNRITSSTPYRTEVVMKSDPNSEALVRGNRFNFSMSEYWIGLSIYIPSNFVIDQVGKTDTLFQVHQSSGTADGIAPPFALRINGSNWNIASRSSGGTKHTNVSLGNSIGKWTDWVIHAKWSDSSNGFLQIWRDGKLIVDRTGPNQYNGETSSYPKMGLYKSVWKPGRPETNTDLRLFYHDELRIGGASSNYNQVAPPGSPPPSGTPPPPPPSTPTPTNPPTPTPTPIPGCNIPTPSWQNFSLSSQTGSFSVEYEVIPIDKEMNAIVALSSNAGSTFDDFGTLLRFANGIIDARNGSSYSADTQFSFNSGTTYHFKQDTNVTNHTYSVWVTPEGESTKKLATDYSFRTPQNTILSITNWGIWSGTGSALVCNFTLSSTPTPTKTPINTPTLTVTPINPPLQGDINGDGVVNILDFQILSNNFGINDPSSDLNGDGVVNILDFQILSNNFGKT